MTVQKSKPLDYREIAKQEYAKCARYPEYFITKYVYIQMTNGGRGKFNLFVFQKKLLHLLHTKDRLIILKSRQLGITTLSAAYALWLMIFRKDQSILALAPDQDKARSILDKIHFAYDELPSWLLTLAGAHSVEKAKLRITLENGSKAVAASGASKSARGKTATFLILDEAAFIEDAIELWGSAQQTLSTGGSAIMLSTPNGTGGLFYQLYTEAENGENEFVPVKLKWTVHPDRDQAWRDRQDKELGSKRMAAQECFDGDTRVYTKHGLRRISEVKEGDEVLTHLGRFNKVKSVFSHESADLYKIKSSINARERLVTKNHPFLYNEKWTSAEDIPTNSSISVFFTDSILPEYTTTIDISSLIKPNYFKLVEEGDFIYINDRKHKKRFPKIVELDYKFGQLIGLYLAEGSKVPNRVTLSFNYKTELNDWAADMADLVRSRYGIEPRVSKKAKGSGNLDFCSQILSQLIDAFVDGDYCYYKKLSPLAYDNMNSDMAKGILDGFFKGDGCILDKYRKVCTTTSEDLSYDIIYLLKAIGTTGITTFKTEEKARVFDLSGTPYLKAEHHTIGVCNSRGLHCTGRNITSILKGRSATVPSVEVVSEESGKTYARLHKKPYKDGPITVYNLEVEEDHTYVTEHGIVHNCDAEFLASGDTYLDTELLDYVRNNTEEPVEKRGPTKSYWIWKYPHEVSNCLVVVDTARGDGADSSAVQVIDLETCEQVAELKEDLLPKDLAKLGVQIAMEYNNALLAVENTGIGNTTCSYVEDTGYQNVFYSPKSDTLDMHAYLDKYMDQDREGMIAGFTNSTKTRPKILSGLQQALLDRSIRVRSKRTSGEMDNFVWKNGKPQAASGKHDDLIITLAIGVFLRDIAMNYQTHGLDMQRAVLNGIRRNTLSAPTYKVNPVNTNPYMVENPYSGELEDISWVVTGKW